MRLTAAFFRRCPQAVLAPVAATAARAGLFSMQVAARTQPGLRRLLGTSMTRSQPAELLVMPWGATSVRALVRQQVVHNTTRCHSCHLRGGAARASLLSRKGGLGSASARRLLTTAHTSMNSSSDSRSVSKPESSLNESGKGTGEDDLMMKIAKGLGKLGGFYTRRQVNRRCAMELYRHCAEHAMSPEFNEICALPDTFQSWFLVAQLHIWMCLVRLKQEGREGKNVYWELVDLFWKDVDFRMRAMGVLDSRVMKESTRELFHMFHGLLFAYDEGLAGDDRVLAAAIWRNLFHEAGDSPDFTQVAKMVAYVREQVQYLDLTDRAALVETGSFKFLPAPKP